MRCNDHFSDHSSYVGVCASCLRQRLIALIAAQSRAQSPQQQQDPPPPPLLFPRSVSPYVSRGRKSHDTTTSSSTLAYPHRFYSTPQVGPTFTTACDDFPAAKKRTAKLFPLISNLFRSRSDKYNSDPTEPTSSSSPSSWFFSTLFPSRRKKKSTLRYADDSTTNGRRPCPISNRGMSPARETESDDDCDRSTWGSGDSTDEWRRTPMSAVPGVRRTRTSSSRGKNVSSGLAFCLSPLVRASPIRQWNQKGGMAGEFVYSGEGIPQLSAAASFCGNRSRKLADFGRVHHNR